MAYTPNPAWADGVDGGTPITAAALQNIEDGIVDAADVADAAASAAAAAQSTAGDAAAAAAVDPAWADVTGKPSSFPPATHMHTVGDVTGLQDALDDKADDVNAGTAALIEAGTDTTARPWTAAILAAEIDRRIAAAASAE